MSVDWFEWEVRDSKRALENARWVAGHVAQFYTTSDNSGTWFWIDMVRSDEEHYRGFAGGKYHSDEADENFSDAVAIVEGVEYLLKLKGVKRNKIARVR